MNNIDKYNKGRVEIDLTYNCNLFCNNCSRCCGIAKSTKDDMSVADVQKFVKESVDLGYEWKRIKINGGEAVLNSQFVDIVGVLLQYKKKYNQTCVLEIGTNGYPKLSEKIQVLNVTAENIKVFNSNKAIGCSPHFFTFNVAPYDFFEFNKFCFYKVANICGYLCQCGTSLNKHGFYSCPMCAAIDRIFGFNLGFKKLSRYAIDKTCIQFLGLCKFCGMLRCEMYAKKTTNFFNCKHKHELFLVNCKAVPLVSKKQVMSKSWKSALTKYKNKNCCF